MEHDAGSELVANLVARPGEMASCRQLGAGVGLDPDAHDLAGPQLCHQVDFAVALLLAKVVEVRPYSSKRQIGTK